MKRREQGFLLATALIFTMLLAILALVTSQNTVTEIRMATNDNQRIRAVVCSESGRRALSGEFGRHIYYRGWPESVGGDLPDALVGPSDSPGLTLLPRTSKTADDTADAGESGLWDAYLTPYDLANYASLEGGQAQFEFRLDRPTGNGTSVDAIASMATQRLNTQRIPGANAAFGQGYGNTGTSGARYSTQVFYDIRSTGHKDCNPLTRRSDDGAEPDPSAPRAVTNADYRYFVR